MLRIHYKASYFIFIFSVTSVYPFALFLVHKYYICYLSLMDFLPLHHLVLLSLE